MVDLVLSHILIKLSALKPGGQGSVSNNKGAPKGL